MIGHIRERSPGRLRPSFSDARGDPQTRQASMRRLAFPSQGRRGRHSLNVPGLADRARRLAPPSSPSRTTVARLSRTMARTYAKAKSRPARTKRYAEIARRTSRHCGRPSAHEKLKPDQISASLYQSAYQWPPGRHRGLSARTVTTHAPRSAGEPFNKPSRVQLLARNPADAVKSRRKVERQQMSA
jgi:hypothetical protein